VNIDNFETKDERRLLPGCCFSIEPGIYLEGKMAARTEINMFIRPNGVAEVTGEMQKELILSPGRPFRPARSDVRAERPSKPTHEVEKKKHVARVRLHGRDLAFLPHRHGRHRIIRPPWRRR
jgi:hypothetical protein